MPPPSLETISSAQTVVNILAGSDMPREIARLYSHHTRLRENQPGLGSWTNQETYDRMDDVAKLIEASRIQREAIDSQINWRIPMRRAAEILEWLTLVETGIGSVSTQLLAAAAYQIAGYPARATGLLNKIGALDSHSRLIEAFLRTDFPELLQGITEYWQEEFQNQNDDIEHFFSNGLSHAVANETVSSLGIVCMYMRWGETDRIERAVNKLTSVSDVMIQGRNSYSWLLSNLFAQAAEDYTNSCLKQHLKLLQQGVSTDGHRALERYYRQKYQVKQSSAWPSQILGITKLSEGQSFALCTPTGSGKTTVAELAIIQGLFRSSENEPSNAAPIVLYIVPSRALATEVEAKLSKVFKNVSSTSQINVTGLYGGTDWGPTDAWLTSDEKTVLICTFEKAEALVKFLGITFLQRLSLVVLDEAHGVQFDDNPESLRKAENRSLRLEALTARLFTYLQQNNRQGKIIALSAVAAGVEEAISQWITQGADVSPVRTPYRSTRQLIGRLECSQGGRFEIKYDVLDGSRLEIQGVRPADQPYIPNPFPSHPGELAKFRRGKSSEQQVRPFLFWAAMHLAAPDEMGASRTVLISITQNISGYAGDFLTLLNSRLWRASNLPSFFVTPTEPEKRVLWQKCLDACIDYFGDESKEYKLLERGIVIHHGNMPGILARLLVEVISSKIVTLVMATSTLSEGVNLPFETVLIPDLRRYKGGSWQSLDIREFSNLVGRAGRPGFGTEGRSLVLLLDPNNREGNQGRRRYIVLLEQLIARNESGTPKSPLAELFRLLVDHWQRMSESANSDAFFSWLEQTAPCLTDFEEESIEYKAIEALDTVDSLLIAAIYEIEQTVTENISDIEMEAALQQIWGNTYARYADSEQENIESFYIHRGQALRATIYPDSNYRRRLYRTSLPPRSGSRLLEREASIREHLLTGVNYASWSSSEKLAYIQDTVRMLGEISVFSPRTGSSRRWEDQLQWWLQHNTSSVSPSHTQVAKWHKDINTNFIYKFNWGFGSVVALAIDEIFDGQRLEPSLEDWPLTGLPWIVFWMKELITWGTLEPVAAFLLARVHDVTTRPIAESYATQYANLFENQMPDEQLNAIQIRDWSQQQFPSPRTRSGVTAPPLQISVSQLLRNFDKFPGRNWRVLPAEIGSEITWLDPAGFPLARSTKPRDWSSSYIRKWDFVLFPSEQNVYAGEYL